MTSPSAASNRQGGEGGGPPEREEVIPRGALCAVKVPAFEGPLDLLLHLCRAHEVDIGDIPIALITEQYLEYLEMMRDLDIDVAGEYLLMAATLAHIKSRVLVPQHDQEEDAEEEGLDPRDELARRLAAFALYREVADGLWSRSVLGRDVFEGTADRSDVPEREPTLALELGHLVTAMRRVLRELPAGSATHQVLRERFTLQDRIVVVLEALDRSESGVDFETVLRDGERSRARIVMTFLAILELARVQAVRIYQNMDERGFPYGPILVRRADAPAPEVLAAGPEDAARGGAVDAPDRAVMDEMPAGAVFTAEDAAWDPGDTGAGAAAAASAGADDHGDELDDTEELGEHGDELDDTEELEDYGDELDDTEELEDYEDELDGSEDLDDTADPADTRERDARAEADWAAGAAAEESLDWRDEAAAEELDALRQADPGDMRDEMIDGEAAEEEDEHRE